MFISKSFFKASGRPNILISTEFAGYQINIISTATFQNSINFRGVGRNFSEGGSECILGYVLG